MGHDEIVVARSLCKYVKVQGLPLTENTACLEITVDPYASLRWAGAPLRACCVYLGCVWTVHGTR